MESVNHPFHTLFEQLGLDASNEGIKQFIASHQLPANVDLIEAPFWSAAQASFLKEGLQDDSDWAEVIDQLNISLR
ncbi:MAG: DUF2789 domain-containing protein [Oceanisphaera sp.]|uniref:DUF2789 domain-containing protein n=1 Tax=Oceanisphaera ostreae TaxID=914151 RepID=A0ABW3KFN2_9GAMM